jgi:hypothetical protein
MREKDTYKASIGKRKNVKLWNGEFSISTSTYSLTWFRCGSFVRVTAEPLYPYQPYVPIPFFGLIGVNALYSVLKYPPRDL